MKTEEVVIQFSEMMISRMEEMKESKWQKPWFTKTYGVMPTNLGGREYNGMNSFFLFLCMNKHGYKYPLFATFKQISEQGGSVLKGEKSFPVLFWKLQYKDQKGEKISEEVYDLMSSAEQRLCEVKPTLKHYNVFNVDQTNLEKEAPEYVEKMKMKVGIKEDVEMPTDTIGMYENAKIDTMLLEQTWQCPIVFDKFSNSAYYSVTKDQITVPLKSQFKKGETEEEVYLSGQQYYSTLLHEIVHSTGYISRLNRFEKSKGKDGYGREELVAEMGAALIGNLLGFSTKILDTSAVYLDAWIKILRKQPTFLVSVLADVNKAAKMILEEIDKGSLQKLKVS